MGDKIRDHRRLAFTTLPGKTHSPIRLRSGLHPASIKIAPGYPVAVRSGREMRGMCLKAGKLLIIIPVDIQNRNRDREIYRRIHKRSGNGNNAADVFWVARRE